MWLQTVHHASVWIQWMHKLFIDEKMVYLLWHEILWMICNMSWIFWMKFMFIAQGGREIQGVWLFYYPAPLKNGCFCCWILNFSLYPGNIFLLCSEEDVSHLTMHILYWFTPTFLRKKKKIWRVLVLIKRYQCLKRCAVVTWSKTWFHFVVLSCSETAEFINLFVVKSTLPVLRAEYISWVEPAHFILSCWYLSNPRRRKILSWGKNTVPM